MYLLCIYLSTFRRAGDGRRREEISLSALFPSAVARMYILISFLFFFLFFILQKRTFFAVLHFTLGSCLDISEGIKGSREGSGKRLAAYVCI